MWAGRTDISATGQQEPPPHTSSHAEGMTAALGAARFFHGHCARAHAFLTRDGRLYPEAAGGGALAAKQRTPWAFDAPAGASGYGDKACTASVWEDLRGQAAPLAFLPRRKQHGPLPA